MTDEALKPVETNSMETAETGHTATARVDVFEKDDEYLVHADMPGVSPQDVDIRYENGELSLHGRRTPSQKGKDRFNWGSEIAGFNRSFRLGEHIASDRIEAELKDGVLKLRLPKTEAVKPRRIVVRG